MHVVLKDTALITPQPGLPVIIPNPATLLVEFQNAEGTAEDTAGATPQLRLYDPQQEPLEITETELWQWDAIAERWRAEIMIDVAAPPVMLAQFSRGEWQSDYFHVVRSAPRKGLGLAELVRDLAAQMPRPASVDEALQGEESRPYMSPLMTKEAMYAYLRSSQTNINVNSVTSPLAEINWLRADQSLLAYVEANTLDLANLFCDSANVNDLVCSETFFAPGLRGQWDTQLGDKTLWIDGDFVYFTPEQVIFNATALSAIRSGLRDNYRTSPVSISTVATLPSASVSLGHISVVTDSNGSPAGANAAGGGSTKAMVCSNGSVWRIIASMP